MMVFLKGGPRAGQWLRLTENDASKLPSMLPLPVWPEPDDQGPPYDRAIYTHQGGLRYEYVRTIVSSA